jgi:hypothetical protein
MTAFTGIQFAPLVPWPLVALLAALAAGLLAFGAWRRAAGAGWRLVALALGLLALANPSLVEEERKPLADVAVLLVDESPSQDIGERAQRTAAAEAALRAKIEGMANMELRVVRAGAPEENAATARDGGTRLFEALERALAGVPRERFAGAIMITDGQVHDAPDEAAAKGARGPLHALLTGQADERDRRIVIEQAPSFGMVGGEVTVTLRVEDSSLPPGAGVSARVHRPGEAPRVIRVPVGASHGLPVKIERGGPMVVDIEVDAGENELTLLNNRAVVQFNGVRDRLRVLLISGEAHAGERVWRNLLKADPAVDLVHFTILRPPEKQDGTPIRELSLIAFPTRELFEFKLSEFDLIVFDRYRRQGLLPSQYLENIADYVRKGGALLEASGPDFATPMSLYRTPLAQVLPGRPTGGLFVSGFLPALTDVGKRHPVTADLPGARADTPNWGRWLRMVDTEATSGHAVLSGYADRPLLLLDRAGKGRVAQLLSDQAWLWARGFEGGGPQAELLRRLAHWLMKEPDLEEDNLTGELQGQKLDIVRRSLKADERPVTVTRPDGQKETVKLGDGPGGRATASIPVRQPGLYRLDDGERQGVAVVGALNPREFADLRATAKLLTPAAHATGGAVRWLGADGLPDIRRVARGRDAEGRGWIGLVANKQYVVTGVRQVTLLPGLLTLALLLAASLLAWRREGR